MATDAMAGAEVAGGVTSGGGTKGGGGGASVRGACGSGGLIGLGGGGGGGGGMITSWITAASNGFLSSSSPLRAVPLTSAHSANAWMATTSAQPVKRRRASGWP